MEIKLEKLSQIFKIVILFFSLSNIYSQETPLGSKIVGNGDALNYYIGHYHVDGSDGLDLHWHGGIRFGDATSTSVMQITNGNVGVGTISPSAKFHVLGANGSLLIDNIGAGENYYNATNFQEFQIGGISKMRLNSVGNLGIGTNSPMAKLHVNNGDNSYGTILANASEAEFSLYTKTLSTNGSSEVFKLGLKYLDNENNGFISFYRGGNVAGGFLGFSTNGQERIRISDTGNVGIGTANPTTKLDLSVGYSNSITNAFTLKNTFDGNGIAGTGIFFTGYYKHALISAYGNPYSRQGGKLQFQTYDSDATLNTGIVLNEVGNVGIGIDTPNNKLDVNGTIHSKEVKVDMTGWSDFVFKKEYHLPTLQEVEKHIKEKGHLENIPSEEEVLKDGINLGEMNTKLLQKIEELTLYSIDQNKKIDAQAKEIEALKDLVLRVTKLESEISRK